MSIDQSFKNLNEIRMLLLNSKSLRTFNEKYKEITSKTSCDKYGMGFDKDGRFSSFKVTVSFDSWAGYYGNSQCSTIGPGISEDNAKKYFNMALNSLQKEIFASMAYFMEKDAAKLKEKAVCEVSKAMKELNNLT
jgi:hypothetical protein